MDNIANIAKMSDLLEQKNDVIDYLNNCSCSNLEENMEHFKENSSINHTLIFLLKNLLFISTLLSIDVLVLILEYLVYVTILLKFKYK